MTRDQTRQLVRGLGSCLALVVLTIGPPAFLVLAVGWPLPTAMPRIDEVRQAITIGVQADVVIKALALVGWVAWMLLAASVVVEVIARIRGRAARSLRGLPGGLQSGIGRLVASSALAITTLGPLHGAAAVAAAPPPALELVAVPATVPLVGEPALELEHTPAEAPGINGSPAVRRAVRPGPKLIVGRHDSYWAIAERALGDPLRWTEIRDLNAGRVMPDGAVVPSLSDHPLPGWELVLPADATVPDVVAAPDLEVVIAPVPTAVSESAAPAEAIVQTDDSLWRLADTRLSSVLDRPVDAATVVPYWLRLIDDNRTRLVDPANPNLIYPGQTFVLPAVDDAAAPPDAMPGPGSVTCDSSGVDEAAPEVPPTPALPDTDLDVVPVPGFAPDASGETDRPAPDTAEDHETPPSSAPERDDADDEGAGPLVLPIAGTVSMALAAGVIEALRRRRRRRNHRSPDVPVTLGQGSPLYQQLAADAGGDAPDRLCYALDQLGSAVVARRLSCRPRIVQQGDDHLDVLLDQPAPRPPDGWEARAEGRIWTRTADGLAADRCGARRPDILDPTPLLVALGEPDEGGQLYLDLESAPVVALTGDRDTAIGVARGFVVELAHSLMAETARILVIGDLGPSVARLDRVSVFETWVEANREIEAHAESSRDAMAAAGWPNGFIGRSSGVWADVLMPLVVVAAGPPLETAALENLLTGDPATAAAVVVGETLDGALRIDCETNQLTIAQLGLTCRPRPLSTDFVDAVVDLLDDAAGGADDEELAESTDNWLGPIDAPAPDAVGTDVGTPPDDGDRPYEDPPCDVLVRVLGDIEVDGTKAPATPKQTALITYIALHGNTDGERLTEALWCSPAGVGSHRKRLTNTLGECRRILDGDHLPPAVAGRYTVGPGVLSDIELWDLRVKAAAAQPLEFAARTLRGAIDLVRGPIFTYRTADRDSYAWVDIENWVAIWEKKITSVAQHLAELYMDLGQVDQAIAVAEHLLQAVQTDTAMTETLMRSHAANGDLRSLERVYQAHVNALEYLDLDAPAESTTTLLDHLKSSTPS